jgi:hypothetical protein
MQMVRMMVIDILDGRVIVDKEVDYDTAEGRRYVGEHAQRAMANSDAMLTLPVYLSAERVAEIIGASVPTPAS